MLQLSGSLPSLRFIVSLMTKRNFKQFMKEEYGYDYGKGEVKRFTPQIKKALEIISKGNVKYTKTQKQLKELGFEIFKSSGVAFVGNSQVIKLGYICESSMIHKMPKADVRVPTTVIQNHGNYQLMVQPKARIPKRMDELNKVLKTVRETCKRKPYDIHSANVGVYKNKPVLFDW